MLEKNKKSLKNILRKIVKSLIFLIYIIFVGSLIIGGISAGIMTLIPAEASKPCYLGYYAHCSFTPFSTLILYGMAILGVILLVKLIKYIKRKYNEVYGAKPIIKTLIKR
ncbi:MAG: hypothetical protein ACFE9T_09740 [Promethearchaeota archaeon]